MNILATTDVKSIVICTLTIICTALVLYIVRLRKRSVKDRSWARSTIHSIMSKNESVRNIVSAVQVEGDKLKSKINSKSTAKEIRDQKS